MTDWQFETLINYSLSEAQIAFDHLNRSIGYLNEADNSELAKKAADVLSQIKSLTEEIHKCREISMMQEPAAQENESE